MKKAWMLLLAAVLSGAMAYADDTNGTDELLQGTPIQNITGLSGRFAFDGDPTTIYHGNSDKMQWVGLDLGTPHVITRVGFMPQNTSQGPDKMLLSVFEGANSPDFMDAVPLYLIPEAPIRGRMNYTDIHVTRGFRYVRYVGSAGSYGDVAELEFYGHEGEGDDSHFFQITSLPTMSIHVSHNDVPQNRGEDFESRSTLIYEDGTLIQEYPVLTRVRGNYSAVPENKPYRVKFNDGKSHHMMKGSSTNEAPVKAKKWVLLNSWRDKTLMRNPVGWAVSQRVKPTFTPWSQPVDLILNGDYRGTYILADQVNASKGRITITEMEPTDIEGEALTGGYFFEADNNYSREPYHFLSKHGNTMSIHDPDDDVMQPEQFNYIKDYFNHAEDILFGKDYQDEESGYQSVFDLESFLKYFLISEFNGNTDMICQVFLYKERGDDHIYTGPVWDHELALDDDATIFPGNERMDWTYKVRQTGQWGSVVSRVLSDPKALARLQTIWGELRDDSVFTASSMTAMVDSFRHDMKESARLNFIRWPYLNQYISLTPAIRGSWDAEVDVVKDYVGGRVAWMDRMLNYNSMAKVGDSYQIYSPRDFVKFIELVNAGESDANAELHADIDLAEYQDKVRPLGSSSKPYSGTIDGGGHTIDHLILEGTSNVALIPYAGAGCTVKNLTLGPNCAFRGESNVASFIGMARNGGVTLTRVGNEGRVEASGVGAAGLIAESRKLATVRITECFNTGDISANNRAAAIMSTAAGKLYLTSCYNAGQVQGTEEGHEFAFSTLEYTLTNCYDVASEQEGVTRITPGDVKSGRLCCLLNEGSEYKPWRQNINNGRARDYHPVPNSKHGVVFEENGQYTNTHAITGSYRYYLWEVTGIRGGSGVIQFAEFGLLDENQEEIPGKTIYSGTESTIRNENWPNAGDGDVYTKYCAQFRNRARFFFDMSRETDIYGYRIYTANDTQNAPERNPVSWKLYGSNSRSTDAGDGTWVLLDERQNDNTLEATNYTPYDFLLTRTLESINLDCREAKLPLGETLQLAVAPRPSVHRDTPILWESTDEKVATVDENGLLTAVGLGKADIIASAENFAGMADTCHVVVYDPEAGFQYYFFELLAVLSGTTGQISEFDLLDINGEEVEELSVYAYTGHCYNGETPYLLVDNEVRSKYCGMVSGQGMHVFFDAGEPITPTAYRMYTANDTKTYTKRNPATWRLWGSRVRSSDPADSCWVLLDERKNDTTMEPVNYTPFTFPIDMSVFTGVEELEEIAANQLPSTLHVYDLSGRAVKLGKRLPRGVYIVGGRKFIVR